ncbi:MAG: nuclease-related domain-containing protein, partial [Candidatus Poribacteria bacterium]|nr:nuclease-related domain-containing protein [Candidatus Poribacteria bacterium]
MARMFSSKNPPNPSAEHTVFETLKRAYKSSDWKVFYSIHVPNSPGQAREIDFLVFIPKYFCIIC